jgi:putative transcriptional regulator
MREFDAACLAVRNIRLSANVSQAVFARYLGTNKSTVQKWESADNRPSAMAQKLLMAVKKHGLDVLS